MFVTRAKELVLSVQHLFAMAGACLLVPLLTGLDPMVALLGSGVGTLIFHGCTKRKMPVFLASSFAFIPPIIAIGAAFNGDLAYAQGGIICVGVIYVLLSLIFRVISVEKVTKVFSPTVVGSMIVIIAFSLMPSALNNIIYMDSASLFNPITFVLAIITLLIAVAITKFGKGFVGQLGIIIALIIGYLLSIVLGLVDLTPVLTSPIIAVPNITLPKFDLVAIITIIPLVLAVFMEHIGDVLVNGEVTGNNFLEDPGLKRSFLGDGLATIFAGLIGAPVNTTYSENTSLLAITKNYNPRLLRYTAVIAIILSFVAIIGAALQNTPSWVVGGISLYLYCMIAWIGYRNIKKNKSFQSAYKTIIVVVMIVLGLGLSFADDLGFQLMVYGFSLPEFALAIAAIAGIVLSIIFTASGKIDDSPLTDYEEADGFAVKKE